MTMRPLFLPIATILVAGCTGSTSPSSDVTPHDHATVLAEQATTNDNARPSPTVARSPQRGASREGSQNPPMAAPAEGATSGIRVWTGREGQRLAVAEFIDLLGDNVCLQLADGQGMVLPIERLSMADYRFVAAQVPQEEQPLQRDTLREKEIAQSKTAQESADSLLRPKTAPSNVPPERLTAAPDGTPLAPLRDRIVIPFDFVSRFDEGRYGRMVGDMLWKKLERAGGCIIPESMLDVRDTCTSHQIRPTADTRLSEMGRYVRDTFGGHVGIWGSVERVPGHDWDVYDVVVRCVDFTSPEPTIIYEKSGRTESISELPHVYVEEMLDALYGREPNAPVAADMLAEQNWIEAPNLVVGDFEQGQRGAPNGWAATWQAGDVMQREPLGKTICWIAETKASSSDGSSGDALSKGNRVIRFTFDAAIGDGTGVAYYSDLFPVVQGARYRFECRYRTSGPEVKVFIKCYDEVGTTYRTGDAAGRSVARRRSDYLPEMAQLREVYRSQQNLDGPKRTWNVQTEDFTPKQTQYTPRWGRVMLYAYLGAGSVDFDDVIVKQIVAASPGDITQNPRHSQASGVTLKDIEQHERRSREAKLEH